MKLPFVKMNGAGNDFVCINALGIKKPFTKEKIAKLCHRQFGIGADGLLLLCPPQTKQADFRMRYFNSDGGEAEMCGNGARCFARFAKESTGWKKSSMSFETMAGLVSATFKGPLVRINLTAPRDLCTPIHLPMAHGTETVHSLNTGVPHTVLFVRKLEKTPIAEWGAEIRYHKAFAPKGTNVNFVQLDGNGILVRTYERGVEAETLACGTGVAASAILASLIKKLTPPIPVLVRSGQILTVDFTANGTDISNVTLTGPAEKTFDGVCYV